MTTAVSDDASHEIVPSLDPIAFDLYKMAIEMADRVSARRANANAFFLTVQSTFVTVFALSDSSLVSVEWWYRAPVAVAGLVLSASWWLQLRSYRDLNAAKFAVINSIEGALPVKVFSEEWAYLKKDPVKRWRDRYAELGTIERVVPGVFALIYLYLFVAGFLN